ncbi:MAG: hypothetical protein WBW16_10325 [Bacteroidota bacterium]
MNHIDEETLELYVLESEEISTRRAEIEAHLRECAGCEALRKEIEEFYSEVQSIREERSKATSQALTLRNVALKVPTYTEFGPLSQIPKTWPARVVLFAIRHPFVSTSGFIALLIAALLLGMMIKTAKDLNLAYARAKDEFLVAYNKGGDELWRKHIGPGYDSEKLRTGPRYEPDKYLVSLDVDGDGKQEVIAAFGLYGGSVLWPMRDAVVCYNADGSNRWVSKLGRKMTFGTESFTDDYVVRQILVTDRNKNRELEVMALIGHEQYYPGVILRLDPSTGSVLSEYWHSGNLASLTYRDIDGDGIAELLAAGQDNAYDMASLTVLDPQAVSGHSPAPPAYTPNGIPAGREKYHILFPRCDVRKVASRKRNVGEFLSVQEDRLLGIGVAEEVDNSPYYLFYFFGDSMKCVRVEGQDKFVYLHRRLEAQGKLSRELDARYYEELRQGVLYWDGDKFVKEPTMNKYYTLSKISP